AWIRPAENGSAPPSVASQLTANRAYRVRIGDKPAPGSPASHRGRAVRDRAPRHEFPRSIFPRSITRNARESEIRRIVETTLKAGDLVELGFLFIPQNRNTRWNDLASFNALLNSASDVAHRDGRERETQRSRPRTHFPISCGLLFLGRFVSAAVLV